MSRRSFLRQLTGAVSVLVGGAQLAGCLGDSDSQSSSTPPATTQSGPVTPTAAAATTQPAPQPVAAPTQPAANSAPVWQPSPTIEFVEGVPAVVSVRDFVVDPDQDPLVITLKSGALLPGITWNPTNYTIAYDGRPLGAKPEAPVVVSGITFTADDRRN